jgi:predicted regulator of Ras-like GTPase activity (Roadblock/LC7/MglB family)
MLSADKEQLVIRLRGVLRNLQLTLPDIEASAVVTVDGITIASQMTSSADPDRLGAMCASLLALADRAGREVNRGRLRQLILDGSAGPMLLTHAGDTAVLAVAAAPTINLGRLILETRKAAAELQAHLPHPA